MPTTVARQSHRRGAGNDRRCAGNQLDAIFNQQLLDQFGPGRYAFLFMPGQYSLDIKLGYYMQVIGLGRSPDDVVINGAVRVNDKPSTGRATGNFWRACENVSILPSPPTKGQRVGSVTRRVRAARAHQGLVGPIRRGRFQRRILGRQ